MKKAFIEFVDDGNSVKGTMGGNALDLMGLLLEAMNHLYKISSPMVRDALRYVATQAVNREDSPVWDLENEDGESSVSFTVKDNGI